MRYYLGTGVCVANKTDVSWYEGDLFCKVLYRGAHLIDIKSEEQLACLPLFVIHGVITLWLKKATSYTWSDHRCVDNRVTALCEW
ncbi:hypothetical protein LSH36_1131g00065 [Paralvinella palmiformis]|uniref:Uncharacterized protein n=1 Tax=Paralvinella palmiformis TaxID=53620 RepID=A0AAD9IUK7_9ANNE|nr:hypothetical protein LSH36_1131g00065 [Paralvinella palmiformis]